MYGRKRSRHEKPQTKYGESDHPPYSRLFVVGVYGLSKDVVKDMFGEHGLVEDVYLLKNKSSGELNGLAYVKFRKRSSAAKAADELNGSTPQGVTKPLKVVPATGISGPDPDIDTKLQRLFVKIPSDMDESGVRENFEKFGEVKSIIILRHKDSGKARGLAYVTFSNTYDAAIAMENCDVSYKPVYAEVRVKDRKGPVTMYERDEGRGRDWERGSYNTSYDDNQGGYYGNSFGGPQGSGYSDRREGNFGDPRDYSFGGPRVPRMVPPPEAFEVLKPMISELARNRSEASTCMGLPLNIPNASTASPMQRVSKYPAGESSRLIVKLSGHCTERMLYKLFDVIPGLDYCDLNMNESSGTGTAHVKYETTQSAAYAKDKWDGFEYPPGCPLQIAYKSQ